MKLEKVKLEDLKMAPRNVRMHPPEQIKELVRSVHDFKQRRPITIDENNVILAGNGLYLAMKELGEKEAYCDRMTGLTEAQKKKFMIADNRIFDLGVDDMKVLDEFLRELRDVDDLDIPGYDAELLETLTSAPDEVDEVLSEYGIVPDDRKEEIKRHEGDYSENPGDTSPGEGTPVATAPETLPQAQHETRAREYVICPDCGKKIWL